MDANSVLNDKGAPALPSTILSSDEEDSDFVDTNYEIDDGDDDMFVDNVDVDVLDEGASRGMRMYKWKKATRLKGQKFQHEEMADDEDLSTNDKGL